MKPNYYTSEKIDKDIFYIIDLYGSGLYEYGLVKLRSILAEVGLLRLFMRLILTKMMASRTKAIKMRLIHDQDSPGLSRLSRMSRIVLD